MTLAKRRTVPCPICGGSGAVASGCGNCGYCNGKGVVPDNICPICHTHIKKTATGICVTCQALLDKQPDT